MRKQKLVGGFVLNLAAATLGFSQSQPAAIVPVRGVIASVSGDMLIVNSSNTSVNIHLGSPLTVYTSRPSDLAHVTNKTFIGVTSVKQPDGSERATEIHIFPEELRGTSEGSFLMDPAPAKSISSSRMTNGIVSSLKTANGSAPRSRMTNGTVRIESGASTLSVQYSGGVQTINIPPNVPVTVLTPTVDKPWKGESVFVLAKKLTDGSLITTKIVSIGSTK